MWYYLQKETKKRRDTIIAVSDTGEILRANGNVEVAERYKTIHRNGKKLLVSRLIAQVFLTTPKRNDQNFVDHIVSNPEGMNINDVRNLRWCSHIENCNFEEARRNKSEARKKAKSPTKGMKWRLENGKRKYYRSEDSQI